MTVTRGVAVGDRRGGLGVGVGCGVAAAKPPSTTTAPAAATILFIVCPFLAVSAIQVVALRPVALVRMPLLLY